MRKIVCLILCVVVACMGLWSQFRVEHREVTVVSYPFELPQKYQYLIERTVAFYLKMGIASMEEIWNPLVTMSISESGGRRIIYLSEHRKEMIHYARYYSKFGKYTVYSDDSIWEEYRCDGRVDTLHYAYQYPMIYDPPEWAVVETDSTFEVLFSPVELPSDTIPFDSSVLN